jgi:hypothetical protein
MTTPLLCWASSGGERLLVEALEGWIDFHEETGRVVPLPELDHATRARVRLVLLALRLNTARRRVARRRLLRTLQRAWKSGDLRYIKEALSQGPDRFVARKLLESKRPPDLDRRANRQFDDPPREA